jgi:hypothetical protein
MVRNVVHASLERSELGSKIAATGQAGNWHPPTSGRVGTDEGHSLGAVEVHIEDDEVWLPVGDGGLDLVGGWENPRRVDAVVEGQLDEFGDNGPIKDHEHTRRAPVWSAARLMSTAEQGSRASSEIKFYYTPTRWSASGPLCAAVRGH